MSNLEIVRFQCKEHILLTLNFLNEKNLLWGIRYLQNYLKLWRSMRQESMAGLSQFKVTGMAGIWRSGSGGWCHCSDNNIKADMQHPKVIVWTACSYGFL